MSSIARRWPSRARAWGKWSIVSPLLAAVLVAGVVVRLWGLGHQSFWYDEISTTMVIKGSLWHTFRLMHTQVNPPLYYVLAWLWTRVTGINEVGLRSLSVVFGVGTIVVAWAALRESVSRAAGIVGAVIVAVNPMLVWYSQEARAYALLTLLGAASFWLALRVVRRPTSRSLAAWSAVCCLALLAHYFAVFIVLTELGAFLWLLPDKRRAALTAFVPVMLVGLALVPLARAQNNYGAPTWISSSPIGHRLGDVVKELATANTGLISSSSGAPGGPWGAIGLAGVVIAVAAALATPGARRSGTVRLAAAIGAAAIVVPLGLHVTPLDYFKDRNLLAAWIPLIAALGGCIALARPRSIAAVALAAVVLAGAAVDVKVQRDQTLQRTNWRAAARLIGVPNVPQAVIVEPYFAAGALEFYGERMQPMPAGARIQGLTVVGLGVVLHQVAPPGFVATLRRALPGLAVLRFRATRPVTMTRALIAASRQPILLQLSGAGERWIVTYLADIRSWADAAANSGDAHANSVLAQAPAAAARLAHLPEGLPNASILYTRMRNAARLAANIAAAPTARDRSSLQQALTRILTAG